MNATTKVSFVALSESFFDRLDIFSDARLLKITLVLLFFGENLLPAVSSSLAWPGARTAPFQFCPNRLISDAKKRSALFWKPEKRKNRVWLYSGRTSGMGRWRRINNITSVIISSVAIIFVYIFAKIRRAKHTGGIVCAAPDSSTFRQAAAGWRIAFCLRI